AAFALDATDAAGRPVLTAEEILLRPVPRAALRGGRRTGGGRLHEVVWSPVPLDPESGVGAGAGAGRRRTVVVALGPAATSDGLPSDGLPADGLPSDSLPFPVTEAPDGTEDTVVAVAAHDDVRESLRAVRELILGLAERTRLVVLTRDAVAADPADPLTGLAQASLWGLVRSAQHEYPGRLALIDTDGHEDSLALLPRAVAAGHGQLALRRGHALRPRLAPVARPAGDAPEFGHGTVLVTGAGGALG
ncbi:hypothetical protein G3I51_27335, partial [Streptomyces sp. SID9944]|nr:hypothetical protein [Streptomyces sp. SID9944]